jgi:hypothetical protein
MIVMANSDAIAYNVAIFISTLFLLEFGADKFVDHTAIVARRTGIPDTVIALLTAGAEWEEVPLGPICSSLSSEINVIIARCRRCLTSAGSTFTGSGKYHRVSNLEYPWRLFTWAFVPARGVAC